LRSPLAHDCTVVVLFARGTVVGPPETIFKLEVGCAESVGVVI
jgi:hypothetical protein